LYQSLVQAIQGSFENADHTFPWTDAASGKRRPALVIDDLPGQALILCQITSRARIPMLSPLLDDILGRYNLKLPKK
jgi:hypothetical protein